MTVLITELLRIDSDLMSALAVGIMILVFVGTTILVLIIDKGDRNGSS